MPFEWDEDKSRANLLKHDVRFETAVRAFDDPYAITQQDIFHDEEEERFITLGAIGRGSILFVIHTGRVRDGEEITRIISARAASSKERKVYEEAHSRAAAGHRRHSGKKRYRD